MQPRSLMIRIIFFSLSFEINSTRKTYLFEFKYSLSWLLFGVLFKLLQENYCIRYIERSGSDFALFFGAGHIIHVILY